MEYYPINLDIENRKCLVVGGGSVGTRKVMTLLQCGGLVTVISPKLTSRLKDLAEQAIVKWKNQPYHISDLDGVFLVIGATDDEALNERISKDANNLGKLCNIADRPKSCNFILPSIIRQGDLIVAISTSGKSPAFAKKLRKQLSGKFGPEYAVFLKLMGAIRRKLLRQAHEPEAHKPLFEKLIHSDLLRYISENDTGRINELLFQILGKGYEYDSLLETENDNGI